MKQATKSETGFTLIEAVITGVIIAIVAIAAVVMYGGFVKETRRQTVENLAETAAAAANAYIRRTGSDEGLDSAKLKIYFSNPDDFTVTIAKGDSTITITDIRHEIAVTRYY
ncbi:MAG: prepilin-type N-terminal cleavage/methylation domain-containing protein [Chitinispirillaceae bacterium]|nr:prepilin-type N-terminal cleavage/methylation domain-containing protein [Chitinispirillaceae bacterium]